jgi:Domain of unknown function (DUF222)
LTRIATPENEEELLGFAMAGTAAYLERLVRYMLRIDRQLAAEREQLQHESRLLELCTDEDGMVVIRGRLTSEAGAALRKALEALGDKLYEEAALSGGLEAGLDSGTRGDRYHGGARGWRVLVDRGHG